MVPNREDLHSLMAGNIKSFAAWLALGRPRYHGGILKVRVVDELIELHTPRGSQLTAHSSQLTADSCSAVREDINIAMLQDCSRF